MTLPGFWQLTNFGTMLDVWADEQRPSADLVNHVVRWVFTRFDDPYQGMRREPDLGNYWWGPIPGTVRGYDVVCCFYRIFETDRRVRCDSFATLSLPL